MNTLPLAEVVATVPPLPYLPDRRGRVWDGAGGTIAECHYQTPATSALLAHAPGALLECVKALEQALNALESFACTPMNDNPKHKASVDYACIESAKAMIQARATLAKTANVPMP